MTQKHQIQLFEEKKVRTVWDDELQEWFFSVADVVEVLTDSVDVKQYIKKMRKRDPELDASWGTICTPTRMKATGAASRPLGHIFCQGGGLLATSREFGCVVGGVIIGDDKDYRGNGYVNGYVNGEVNHALLSTETRIRLGGIM